MVAKIEYKFQPNDFVRVDPLCGGVARLGIRARIQKLEPYRGRPGYYIYWDYRHHYGRPAHSHESSGGWFSEGMLSTWADES